ncbi:MAG: hypothetical protein ABR599_05160 [Gemmatimonadota bacterium]
MLQAGCGATIREEALRAERRLAPGEAGRLLGRAWSRLEEGKRIFDIRLSERVRVLNGEGALLYRTRPTQLRLDVFGPHATLVLSLAQDRDSMAVRLPEERRVVSGAVGDPAFAELTEGRGFTGHEVLGALLGAYDVEALLGARADTVGFAAGGEWVVTLLEPERAHRFTYARADSALLGYRQERDGRAAYRVRFSDYRDVEGLSRPFRIELQDVEGRRTVRVQVRQETFRVPPGNDAFRVDAL